MQLEGRCGRGPGKSEDRDPMRVENTWLRGYRQDVNDASFIFTSMD